ncbi:ribosome small subunit-dependent GTPase A [Bacillus daqingensis]|uniref:Small ribosomal subunit biogenesis GTPase RsgA n=1 Tax=Bacillus daqingensis TaxID=872396 RepID=A0ABV9NVH3_9BACI
MAKGRIIKALSGFYYVESEGQTVQCRARGNFRKKNITPLVGDMVEFEAENPTDGYILAVEARTSELFRPPIANIDQAILVFSAKEPDFSPLLLDKFLVHTEAAELESVICVSKADLGLDKAEPYLPAYEQAGYRVIITSSELSGQVEELLPVLSGRLSVFAGQSGVGKSSILNALKPELNLETAAISKSLNRGKHTTRHVELIHMPNQGFVADTPGFSSLDFRHVETETLSAMYPEMAARINDCKFRGCTHLNEPGCAVKQAVDTGDIAAFRYHSYQQFYEEIANRKRRY